MRKITNEELGRPSAEEFAAMAKMPVVVVLDNIRSLQNVGAFFRTSDAFAVERIALCGITATPPNRDIHKTALGAELTVPWRHYAATEECLAELKAEGYSLWAVEQVEGAVRLGDFRPEALCAGLRQRGAGRGAAGRGPLRRGHRDSAGRDKTLDQRLGVGRRRVVALLRPALAAERVAGFALRHVPTAASFPFGPAAPFQPVGTSATPNKFAAALGLHFTFSARPFGQAAPRLGQINLSRRAVCTLRPLRGRLDRLHLGRDK